MSQPDPGTPFGRWRVVKRAPPARRYGETYSRSRVEVECVCGHRQTVFVSDLQSEKTTGCRRRECQTRWQAKHLLREFLAGEEANGG